MSEKDLTISLIGNLPLLMDNFELIKQTPEYYFIPVTDAWIGSAYITRKRTDLFLGNC